jgi:hypothetical protein
MWSETKEKVSYFGNSGQTGGSLWQGCLTTSPTEPSSLVRESGIHPIASNFDMITKFLWPIRFSCCVSTYANFTSRQIPPPYDGRIRPYQYGSRRVPATRQPVTVPRRAERCRYGDGNRITDTVYTALTGYGGQPYRSEWGTMGY